MNIGRKKLIQACGRVAVALLMTIVCALEGATDLQTDVQTASIRLEHRTDSGARIVRGNVTVSPVAEMADESASLKVDNSGASGWSVASPEWNSASAKDGWHTVTLQENGKSVNVDLMVLNDYNVVIHESTLTADETWAANKVHIVTRMLNIPADRTLTVEAGAVVKFFAGTGFDVSGTLNAENAYFTALADDGLGGDTECNGQGKLEYGTYSIDGSGTINMAGTQCRLLEYEAEESNMELQTRLSGVESQLNQMLSLLNGGKPGQVLAKQLDGSISWANVQSVWDLKTLHLTKGWNLVAIPEEVIIEESSQEILDAITVYSYDKTIKYFLQPNDLLPMTSYWFYVEDDCELHFGSVKKDDSQ